jgi:hypothetical protein
MLSYIKLFSGKIYEYNANTFPELISLLARDLGVRSNYIRILNIPEGEEIKTEGETFYAFIEEPKIIDNVYLEVSDKGDIYLSRPFRKLFANSFRVFVDESKFTKEVIDKFRLELWLVGDYDTKDMSLSELAKIHVENIANMNIESIVIL